MNATAHQADTRQKILDAARELFHTRSYGDVGVQAICEHAGVKKGSFYHFFPSKRDLTLAVIDEYLETFRIYIVETSFLPNIPPMERFRHFTESAANFQAQLMQEKGNMPGCPFGNLAVEMSTQDEIIRQKLDAALNNLRAPFLNALEEAVANGDIPPLDTTATAEAMLAYVEGLMLLAKTRNDPELIRNLGPAVTGIRVELAASAVN